MKLQDQVCTLEQAKRLRELGLRNNSLLKWVLRTEPRVFWNAEMIGTEAESWQKPQDELPAFTVAELGAMLPRILDDYSLREWGTTKGKIRCQYRLYAGTISDTDFPSDFIESKYEAQARADLLIHLLESGKITAAEVNERLDD